MKKSCVGLDSLCEKFDCHCKESKDGIQIELKAKDPAKKGSLKALAKACRDFCGCC